MIRTRYRKEIEVAAKAHGLDPLLVEAIVVQESSGNADGFRFEPNYWNRYMKNLPAFRNANPRRVSSSYGLMQIMYQVALERGYDPTLAPETLFVPETNLHWCCKHLATLFKWAQMLGTEDWNVTQLAAIAAYNGGRGGNDPTKNWPLRSAKYAQEVLAKRALLVKEYSQ